MIMENKTAKVVKALKRNQNMLWRPLS